MSAAELRIARDLALPIDAVTQAIAILARKGAGKTYTAKKIVEEVVKAKIPVVVIDPTGGWWGLRTSADGERPGLPVVIFGGDHADVPLERSAGKVIADVVLEHAGAYILDLSGFESRAAEQTFVADFLERLYRGKKRETGPLLLVVDEADMFAPQRPGPEQTRSLGALEAIVRRGRIKGLGDLLITQRAAVLNKNVLTQTEVLVVMQTTGPQDRAAIDAWIEGNGTREERDTVLASLASLERGEAWVWSPSFLRVLQRVRILPGTTFDSSRTPEAGEITVTPRAFAKVDLEQLGERIAATIEKSKADDPKELRRRIAELERGMKNLQAAPASVPVVERVEVPVLNGQVAELRGAITDIVTVGMRLLEIATAVGDAAAVIQSTGTAITTAIDRVAAAPRPGQERVQRAPVPPVRVAAAPTGAPRAAAGLRPTASSGAPREPGEVRLDAGARRMLTALARLHPTPLLRSQLGTLADIAWTSGTFRGYLSSLRTAGLIDEPDKSTVQLSPAGEDLMAGELGSGAPSVEELVEMWNRKLDAGARRMLRVLVDINPDGISRADLGERVEISASSGTFRGYLSKLRVNRLLDESGGLIRAGEALFLGGRS